MHTGRPLGTDAFVTELESLTKPRLVPSQGGRQPASVNFRRRFILFLLSLAHLGVVGCHKQADLGPKDLPSLSISIRKEPCMLRCKVFNITAWGTGKASYEGIDDVPVLGARTATLSPESVSKIISAINGSGFMRMNNKSFKNSSDVGAVRMSVSANGTTKDVWSTFVGFPPNFHPRSFFFERPEDQQYRFLELVHQIYALVGTDRWTNCSPACTSLLRLQPVINARNRDGDTILMYLVKSNEKSVEISGEKFDLDTLIEAGVDVNGADSLGRTPLMVAARNGNIEWVRTLLAHEAKATAKDMKGQTALNYAKSPEIRDLLSSPANTFGHT